VIKTVKEIELGLTGEIVCPNCGTVFESDADILSFVIDTWEDRAHTKHKGTGYYECPICSMSYDDIRSFYVDENE